MNVRVDSTSSNNHPASVDDIRVRPHSHLVRHSIHCRRVPSLANCNNATVLNTDVGFEDSRPVDDHRVDDNQIKAFGVGAAASGAHAVAQSLATAYCALVTVDRKVFLDLDPKISRSQADQIASGRSVRRSISRPIDRARLNRMYSGLCLWHMSVSRLLEILQYLSRTLRVHRTFRKATASLDGLGAADLYKCDSLGFIRLKAQKLSCWQIEMVAISFFAIEFEVGVGLHEMEVGADLRSDQYQD